jgi:HAD superfamily hydrolase (TIGR01484 family)
LESNISNANSHSPQVLKLNKDKIEIKSHFKVIKLLVTDLDGCISHPFNPPNWNAISQIKDLNEQSEESTVIPALTLCTGRPYPYAEAVAQWLNVRFPILFESGVGSYHPKTNNLLWSSIITPEIQDYFDEIRRWTEKEILPRYPNNLIEYTKKIDVGLVSPNKKDIMEMFDLMVERTKDRPDLVEVHNTDVSVNVIYKHCNKGTGLLWLSQLTGIEISEMAYIGDGMNDAPALELAPYSFAPFNSRIEAKNAAKMVLNSDSTHAVLEAYQFCINLNKSEGIQ